MNIYISIPRCSCIVCHKEYSVKGIGTHYTTTHTAAGRAVRLAVSESRGTIANYHDAQRARGVSDVQANSDAYLKNPKLCKHCNTILPYAKRGNNYCNRLCAAPHRNADVKGVFKLPRHKCEQCDSLTLTKYCSKICCGKARQLVFNSPEEKLAYKRNRVREVSANYRARLHNQTPFDADRPAIRAFYALCPVGSEVDHIIPISKGGLHTLSNLQYLTQYQNRSKGAKL